jgi:hypothetical protein
MKHDYRVAASVRPLLSRHLERLQEAMYGLSEQTRAALARLLAGVAAGLVGEAARCALAAPDRPAPLQQRLWQDASVPPLIDPLDDLEQEISEDRAKLEEDWCVHRPAPERERADAVPPCGSAQLALGLRVAAWWLSRSQGSTPLLAALALGTAAALSCAVGGPLVLAGFSLVEALLGVIRLGGSLGSAPLGAGLADGWEAAPASSLGRP